MSNALIKLTEEQIDSNDKLQTFVQKAKALTNPIFPETVQFTDTALKYGAALVSVDLQLDKYGNNRDIYKNESGGYCLHLSKLNEIAQQSGIQIIESRIAERKVDETGKAIFISHFVRGRLRSVDGSIKEDVATGKYDYFRDLEKYNKEGQIKSRRSHAEALAESNAKTRLFNKMVAKLPTSYTLDELKKPFLIPYVLEDKNELLKDLPVEVQTQIKADLARKRLGLSSEIYSVSPALPEPQNQKIVSKNDNAEDAQVVDESGISKEEENKILAEEYREQPQRVRTEKIMNLIQLKGWKHPQGVEVTEKMIEKADIDTQINRIYELLNMPNIESEVSL